MSTVLSYTPAELRSNETQKAFTRWLRPKSDRTSSQRPKRAKGTVRSYWKQFLTFIDWWESRGTPPWTPRLFDQYLGFLGSPQARKIGKTLSIKTVKLRVLAVRAFAAYLTSEGEWKKSPAQYLSARTPQDPLRSNPFEVPAIKALFGQFDESEGGLRDRAIVLLLATMGLRIAECCRLNLGDYVPGSDEDGHAAWVLRVPSRHYQWDRRKMVVTEAVKGALDRYLACRPAGELGEPLFIVARGEYQGNRVDPGGVGIRLSRAFRATGLAHPSGVGHSLRLAAVQFAIEKGATKAEVKAMLRVRELSSVQKHFDKAGSKQPVVRGAQRYVTQLSELA